MPPEWTLRQHGSPFHGHSSAVHGCPGSLIVVSRLLLLLLGGLSLPTVTELAWRTLGIPFGTSVSKMPKLTALEASIASRRCGVVVSHRDTDWSVLTILLGSGALS